MYWILYFNVKINKLSNVWNLKLVMVGGVTSCYDAIVIKISVGNEEEWIVKGKKWNNFGLIRLWFG